VTRDILERFAEIARGEILKEFGIDSCIASTRVTLEVMRSLKIPAKPLHVRLFAMNRAMAKNIDEFGYPDPETLGHWCSEDGAHSVGVGYGAPPGVEGWNGHLVAFVGTGYLVDASLDQVERPQKNLLVPVSGVFWTKINQAGFITGKIPMIRVLPSAVLRYEVVVPPDLGYKDSPNWRLRYQTAPAVGRILKRLKR